MLIFDQLKKNDPQLRILAIGVFAGLSILLAGLWWVQIVSARDYEANLQTQSFRTVRIPAARGRILDHTGEALAENRPSYSVCLYLEELRKQFDAEFTRQLLATRGRSNALLQAEEARLGRELTKQEKKRFSVSGSTKGLIRQEARFTVASNTVTEMSRWLQQPLLLDRANFQRHYETRLALPFTVLANLEPMQIARLLEQSTNSIGVDVEILSSRIYPHQTLASHVLGYLKRDDSSTEGEEAFFSYRLPDFKGLVGIEGGFDQQLRGRAGAKSVLVNNVGYRQSENVWSPAESGNNVKLTIDANVQRAAEAALPVLGPGTRAAAVVLEVHTGDVVAMASTPSYDPNHFIAGFPPGARQRLDDPRLRPQINRATQENYAPGSIFKPIVGLAALEAGLNHREIYRVQPNPANPNQGIIYVGRRAIRDLAAPGDYDFTRALLRSSNSYFITNGLRFGVDKVVVLSQKLHLGERTGLPTRQEVAGIFPSLERTRSGWTDGDTANLCIGQGMISVTPLQMAVVTAAIANGGTVLWPRLVERIEPMEPLPGQTPTVFPTGRVRDYLGVKRHNLAVLHQAMLQDTESPEGTGKAAAIPGYRVCGKTGTAQVTDARNELVDHITWFASFAPFENPKYAVVVMVESGGSGGATCAPIARNIYLALMERDRGTKASTVATVQRP